MKKEDKKKVKKVDTNIEDWRKEFRKKFGGLFSLYTAKEINEEIGTALFEGKYNETIGKDVIDFIQSLLEQERKKILKDFIKYKKEYVDGVSRVRIPDSLIEDTLENVESYLQSKLK